MRSALAPPLYHYTCPHFHEAIQQDGFLRPAINMADRATAALLKGGDISRMTCQVVWLTTMPSVVWLNGGSLGLTSHGLLDCDRTKHRYRVVQDGTHRPVMPWSALREAWPVPVVVALESAPGARPDTWWASRGPLAAVYDPHQIEHAA